jgi:hypothetical protein
MLLLLNWMRNTHLPLLLNMHIPFTNKHATTITVRSAARIYYCYWTRRTHFPSLLCVLLLLLMNVHVVTIIVERDINITGELINITIVELIRTIIIIVSESILIIINRTTIIVAIEVMMSLLLRATKYNVY